ncbi:MAG: hypothetical protein AB7S93_17730 [Xanthobacteraceae bacterium]|jgi:hypothetical protein
MKDHGVVSKRAKDVIVEVLCQWVDLPETADESPLQNLSGVVDTLINNLDSAGFAIEIKAPVSGEVIATDVGRQALRMKRAEEIVKEWLIEQGKTGPVPLAHHAPGWSDYQREYANFNLAIAQAKGA